MFSTPALLREHKKLHWDREKVLCCEYEDCGAFYIRHQDLVNHQQQKHQSSNDRRYICTHGGCSASFQVPYGLQVHKRRHRMKNTPAFVQVCEEPLPLFCGTCTSMEEIKLEIFDAACSVDECLCDEGRICNNEGTDWEILMCSQCALEGAHVTCSGETVNRAGWRCLKCRTENADVPEVSMVNKCSCVMCHVPYIGNNDPDQPNLKIEPSSAFCDLKSNTERPYKCEFSKCNKSFFKIKNLQKHARKHTGKKPFECLSAGCEENFNTLQLLTDHQAAVHTNAAPYKHEFPPYNALFDHTYYLLHEQQPTTVQRYTCPFDGCSASFTRHSRLKLHQSQHSGLTYKCNIGDCTESFWSAYFLEKHIEEHSDSIAFPNNKSYTCPHEGCGAMFLKSALLQEHKKLHWDKVKVLCCEYEGCDAVFIRHPDLTKHQQKHQYSRLFKCTHGGCTASFQVPYGLEVHMRRHHKKNTPDCTDATFDQAVVGASMEHIKLDICDITCTANECLCAEGRNCSYGGTHWEILICSQCALEGAHVMCSGGTANGNEWKCLKCRTEHADLTMIHEASKKLKRKSQQSQKEELVSWMERNKKRLHTGVNPAQGAEQASNREWEKLTAHLNSLMDSSEEKEVKDWQRAWKEMKWRCRRKYQMLKEAQAREEIGDLSGSRTTPLNELEVRVLAVMKVAPKKTLQSLAVAHKTPTKLYTCSFDDCSASFTSNSLLKAHDNDHPYYPCTVSGCTMTFRSMDALNQHLKEHSDRLEFPNKKPYMCPHEGCGAVFGRRLVLEEHKKQHWDKAKVFNCEYPGCSAFFLRHDDLLKHHRQHQSCGDRLYKCPLARCTATFHKPIGLQVHMGRHDKKKKSPVFIPDGYSSPRRKYHEGSQWKCCACGAAYGLQASLRAHLQKKHKMSRKMVKRTIADIIYGCNQVGEDPLLMQYPIHDAVKMEFNIDGVKTEVLSNGDEYMDIKTEFHQPAYDTVGDVTVKTEFIEEINTEALSNGDECMDIRTECHQTAYDTVGNDSLTTEFIIENIKTELLCNGDEYKDTYKD